MQSIGFIVNPLSGDGRGANIWKEVETYLQQNQIPHVFKLTAKAGEATELTISMIQEHKVGKLIVIGGDGTIHEAAQGLAHIHKEGITSSLAVIPSGTGNDFAKAYGIPMHPLQALNIALTGTKRVQIDLLRTASGVVAVNSIGAGFDGMVAKLTNESNYKKVLNRLRLGKLSYFLTILRVFATYKPCTAWLEVDGKVHELPHMWLAAVANIPFYGGAIQICPSASPYDGIADIVVIQSRGRFRLLPILFTVYQGNHIRHPAVSFYKGTSISLRSQTPLLIQADGEYAGATPLQIVLAPSVITVIC
ncbi:diacylglycerol/lipid kinase family protein [Paenibacillus aceris]|uniref:YegS/Rv2252/BmrU family lipid kinase n=1 Tax=Paenibacillus aceris TaxID=869555 RepID=A0ABS4I945_9BACL|nr:diacylglycerol kinase family protein [Paenibacillus aceris]MBP1967388.1 YegS/Rv2252/BmrU family lipid kinase [Paenibacillus aceris]NHW39256.1 diacylglycerol kinase family lipid kinase [Paenibacillus aceris]